MIKLEGLSIQNKTIYGDISNLRNCINLQNLRLYDSSVSGNIASLANCTNLIHLNVNKPRSTLTGTSEQTWNIFGYSIIIAIIVIQISMVISARFLTYLN